MSIFSSPNPYSHVAEQISLEDNTYPSLPSSVKRFRDLSEKERAQCAALFDNFDVTKQGSIDKDDLIAGLRRAGISCTLKSAERMVRQMHLSDAPKDRVKVKGFTMSLTSKTGLLWEFLYDNRSETSEQRRASRGANTSFFSSMT